MTFEELVENFELIGEWEDRYEYIADLGKRQVGLPDEDKTDATRVHGCLSKVWLVGRPRAGEPGVLDIVGEGEGDIIAGLVSILILVFSGKTREQVMALDPDAEFGRLGLFEHLSPTRHVGVYAMVERIRQIHAQMAPHQGGDATD